MGSHLSNFLKMKIIYIKKIVVKVHQATENMTHLVIIYTGEGSAGGVRKT